MIIHNSSINYIFKVSKPNVHKTLEANCMLEINLLSIELILRFSENVYSASTHESITDIRHPCMKVLLVFGIHA